MTDFRLRLYWDSFVPIPCVLPSVPEQRKIAKILTTQDKVIELRQKETDELKKLKRAYLSKVFPQKGKRVPELRFNGFTENWEQMFLSLIPQKMKRPEKPVKLVICKGVP